MAGKYLGAAFDIHGGGVDLRFPHHENEQAQSRAAGLDFASYWLHNAWITTSGEKMSKSLGNSLLVPNVLERVRGIELRYYMVAAHYRSNVEFSFEALDEAAAGFRRIESFLERAGEVLGGVPDGGMLLHGVHSTRWTTTSAPRPRSPSIFDAVREGNKLLADGATDALRGNAAAVRAMLGVLGLDPFDPHWAAGERRRPPRGRRRARARPPRPARPGPGRQGLRRRRRHPRPDQGRRRRGRGHPRRPEMERLMPGNSQRKGAIRKTGKGPTVGSGGRVKRGLEGKGPTPKAKDRPNHKAYKQRQRTDKAATARSRRPAGQDRPGVGRRAQQRRRGAARQAPRHRGVRRRGRRARRPAQGGLRDRRRPRVSRCSRCRAPSSTG